MNDFLEFRIYRRRKDAPQPGHSRIYVYWNKSTNDFSPTIVGGVTNVQCATLDRIPFVMTQAKLKARYEPDQNESPEAT